jgi:hypothetical protein
VRVTQNSSISSYANSYYGLSVDAVKADMT